MVAIERIQPVTKQNPKWTQKWHSEAVKVEIRVEISSADTSVQQASFSPAAAVLILL